LVFGMFRIDLNQEKEEEPMVGDDDDDGENEDLSAYESDQEDLPEGWIMRRHANSLPFWYHKESGVICWTKPYSRKVRAKVSEMNQKYLKAQEHTPPLSAFKVILKYHDKEMKEAIRRLDEAKKKR
jgi:hypothetical protein